MKLRNKRTGEIVEVESCNSYTGTIGYLKNSKPQGKAIYSVGGKWFEADYNFGPPKVREIKEKKEEE